MVSNTLRYVRNNDDNITEFYDQLTSEEIQINYYRLPIVLIEKDLASTIGPDEETPQSLEVSSAFNITTHYYTRKLCKP